MRQLNLIAQRGAKCCQGTRCIIFAAIEAPINDPLNSMTQRLEQKVDHQRGEDDDHTAALVDDATQQRLQANHQAHVDPRQDDRQRAIDQGAVDDDIDIPQPVAQNGDGEAEDDREQDERKNRCQEQVIERTCSAQRWEDERGELKDDHDQDGCRDAEDDPLGLLALDWVGYPLVAVEQCDHNAGQLAQPYDVTEQAEGGQRRKEDQDQPTDDPYGDKPARPTRYETPSGDE